MSESSTRNKVLDEIRLIPENKLAEVYDFLHYFRIGIKKSAAKTEDIMEFAGSWKDMPEETFSAFIQEIYERRRIAFPGRSGA